MDRDQLEALAATRYNEGRLERADRALRIALEKCPTGLTEKAQQLRDAVDEELHADGDPDALFKLAAEATGRRDRSAAQRAIDHAVARLEKYGAHVALDLSPPVSTPIQSLRWSAAGETLAVFTERTISLVRGPSWDKVNYTFDAMSVEFTEFSPEGEFIASYSPDSVTLRRTSSPDILLSCKHADGPRSKLFTFSRNGNLFACWDIPQETASRAAGSHVVQLYDLKAARRTHTLTFSPVDVEGTVGGAHSASAGGLAFSSGGGELVAGGGGSEVRVWDTHTGALLDRPGKWDSSRSHRVTIMSAPAGDTVLIDFEKEKTLLWSRSRAPATPRIDRNDCELEPLALFDNAGKTLISSASDGGFCVWNTASASFARKSPRPTDPRKSSLVLAPIGYFAGDGGHVLSTYDETENLITLRETTTGKVYPDGTPGEILLPTNADLLVGRPNDHRYLLEPSAKRRNQKLCTLGKKGMSCVAMPSPNTPHGEPPIPDAWVIVPSGHESLIVDPSTGQALRRLAVPSKNIAQVQRHDAPSDSIVVQPQGELIASTVGGRVFFSSFRTGKALSVVDVDVHMKKTAAISFGAAGGLLVIPPVEEYLPLLRWGLTRGPALSWHRPLSVAAIDGVELGDGTIVSLVIKGDKTVLCRGETEIKEFEHLDQHNTRLSPRGDVIAVRNESIVLISAETGEKKRTLEGSNNTFLAPVFSPDGSAVGALSRTGELRVWSTSTGETLLKSDVRSPVEEGAPKRQDAVLAIAPGGHRVVVALRDSGLRVITSGEAPTSWTTNLTDMDAMAFDLEGKLLAISRAAHGIDLFRTSDHSRIATLSFQNRQGLMVTPTGHVGEIGSVGSGAPTLWCHLDEQSLPLAACRDRWFVDELMKKVLASDTSYLEP